MVMEQHSSSQNWKLQLLGMGYREDDVSRAYEAGVTNVTDAIDWIQTNEAGETNVTDAIDWIQTNPSHHSSDHQSDYHLDTSQQWATISDTVPISDHPPAHHPMPSSNATDSHNHQHEDFKETPCSTDNPTLARPGNATPAINVQTLRNTPDEQLQRALEMSRKEEDDRELERAMRMSKQDIPARQSGDQDPEFIRALEESLKDSPDIPNNQDPSWHSQAFVSPLERIRKNIDDPVGLRNIGNTCYLNSLLQVYYYLPDFRRAIMSFRAPDSYCSGIVDGNNQTSVQTTDEANDLVEGSREAPSSVSAPDCATQEGGASDNSDNRINKLTEEGVKRNAIEFVIELQRLFSLMALGKQNCADPTAVTKAMRDNQGKPISIGAQRDASEFNQLFLDIVEKGLSASSSNLITEDCHQDKAFNSENIARQPISAPENIVKNMFTMKFRQEIWRCANNDSRDITASKQPITTNWETTSIIVDATTKHERNLYGGLEDFVLTQIKYLDRSRDPEEQPGTVVVSNEEKNTSHISTEAKGDSDIAPYAALKTVWFTRLPPVVVIYLQRGSYNRETLRAEKVHDQYEFPTRLAFDRYLEVNREAAEAARKEIQAIRKERKYVLNMLDQYKRFPSAAAGIWQDACTSCSDHERHDNERLSQDKYELEREDFFEAGARIQKRLREAMQPESVYYAVSSLTRERIESSLDTIEKILDHDRKRCNELEARLQSIKAESDVYRGLDKVRYDLHAVLVHDGAPDSGHYWTFISNLRPRNEDEKWVKLSDSNVSLVSEKEMLSWSLGGNGKASAYCLMYTTANNTHEKLSISEESISLLPQEAIDKVAEASAAFKKEVEATPSCNT